MDKAGVKTLRVKLLLTVLSFKKPTFSLLFGTAVGEGSYMPLNQY